MHYNTVAVDLTFSLTPSLFCFSFASPFCIAIKVTFGS